MKKIIATSMAVLLAAPAFAGGQKYEQQPTNFMGWDILPYVTLRGGATYGNLNYTFNDTKESVTQNMYQVRAALGGHCRQMGAALHRAGKFATNGNTGVHASRARRRGR